MTELVSSEYEQLSSILKYWAARFLVLSKAPPPPPPLSKSSKTESSNRPLQRSISNQVPLEPQTTPGSQGLILLASDPDPLELPIAGGGSATYVSQPTPALNEPGKSLDLQLREIYKAFAETLQEAIAKYASPSGAVGSVPNPTINTKLDIEAEKNRISKDLADKVALCKLLKEAKKQKDVSIKVEPDDTLSVPVSYDHALKAAVNEFYEIKIKGIKDRISLIRKAASEAKGKLPKATEDFNDLQTKINSLILKKDDIENVQIESLKTQALKIKKEAATLFVREEQANKEIKRLKVKLELAQKNAADVSKAIEKSQTKQGSARTVILLAEQFDKLIPVKAALEKMPKPKKTSERQIRPDVKAYDEAREKLKKIDADPLALQTAEKAYAAVRKDREGRINSAEEQQKVLLDKERLFLEAQISSLRGPRHQDVVSKMELLQKFYDDKSSHPSSKYSLTSKKAEIRSLDTEILKKKVSIAEAKAGMSSSLPMGTAQLELAIHRLERHQAEQKWRVSREMADKKTLDGMLRTEQELVFKCFALKLSRPGESTSDQNKYRVTAEFTVLNLILDRLYIELFSLSEAALNGFDLPRRIGEYLQEAQTMSVQTGFSKSAYPKQTQNSFIKELISTLATNNNPSPATSSTPVVDKMPPDDSATNRESSEQSSAPSAIESPLFPPGLATNKGPTNTALIPSIPQKFSQEIEKNSRRSEALAAKLVNNKLALIQTLLERPFQSQFEGDYKQYKDKKKTYQDSKYAIKKSSASLIKEHIGQKPSYKAAEKDSAASQDEKQRIQTQKELEHTTLKGRVEAALQGERNATQTLKNKEAGEKTNRTTRDRAMTNYGWVEQLSYLIPTAVLWVFYLIIPSLGLIPLSLRVSQNILLIGSATHLFVQNFFRKTSSAEAQ